MCISIQPDWISSGQNNHNTRSAATEHTINASNVGDLKTASTFTTAGDVSATAIVVNGIAYFPDWSGKLWAVDTKTGKAIWSHDVSNYTGTAGSASRTSPAYWNGELVIGTGNLMTRRPRPGVRGRHQRPYGAMLWRTETDANQAAIVTGSATIDDGTRVLARFGNSVTTDHISPAGSIKKDSPAGKYLMEHGVQPADFNSYGSRRGNHEVMMRGTFANTRIRNKLVPHIEGGYTKHIPGGKEMTIYDAAMQYRSEGVPVIVIAGKEYGAGRPATGRRKGRCCWA